MSLSSLGQLALSNRRRQLEAIQVKPVLIKVANEPIQLIQDLMRLTLTSKTKGRPKKKLLERQKAVDDLTAALASSNQKAWVVEISNQVAAEECETLANNVSTKVAKDEDATTAKDARAENFLVAAKDSKRGVISRQRGGTRLPERVGKRATRSSSAGRQLEVGKCEVTHIEEAESEDELRLELSLSEDELII